MTVFINDIFFAVKVSAFFFLFLIFFRSRTVKITADTHMTDVFKSSIKVQDVLKKYGLPCAGCRGAAQDTVAIAADNYSVDLKAFLEDLNKVLA